MSTPATALELRLTGRQTTYKLDLGGRTPAEFRQHIEQLLNGRKGGDRPLCLRPLGRQIGSMLGVAGVSGSEPCVSGN